MSAKAIYCQLPDAEMIRDCSFQIVKEFRVYLEFTYCALPNRGRRSFMSVVSAQNRIRECKDDLSTTIPKLRAEQSTR